MQTPDAMLIDATDPWRLSWMTFGPYDDGWLKPHVPARIRLFPTPGQRVPTVHYLYLQVWAPPGVTHSPFGVLTNRTRFSGSASDSGALFVQLAPGLRAARRLLG